ncbi:hypothetical protein HispidOSU_019106, partial [Sigmodon hispidus]
MKGIQGGNQYISSIFLATTMKLKEPLGEFRHLASEEEDEKLRDDFVFKNSATIFYKALHEDLAAEQDTSLPEIEKFLWTLGNLGHYTLAKKAQ